jgi:serine/threonine protein kinase
MDSIDLGKIKLGKQIGVGGYGVVYEADLTEINHKVAVKVLDPSPFQGSTSLERFIQEAKILLTLKHPHIISIYGLGIHEGKPFIMMELFNGFDLYRASEKGRPTPAQVLPFIRMSAMALGYAHSKSIVHRDLKPNNLMTLKGDARVIDFGIGKIVDPEGERFTKDGGTPIGNSFTAPELLDNPRLIDPKCDIYSLGACWFWTLTGQAPNGRNWESALTSIDGMSPEYSSVLFKALDRPEKRFGSMDELVQEVRLLEVGGKTNSHDELFLDDETLQMLGLIYEQEDPGDDGVTFYTLERQANGSISKFTMKLAIERLLKRQLIEIKKVNGWQEEYFGYFMTISGREWVNNHRVRIENLLYNMKAPQSTTTPEVDEDLPF